MLFLRHTVFCNVLMRRLVKGLSYREYEWVLYSAAWGKLITKLSVEALNGLWNRKTKNK